MAAWRRDGQRNDMCPGSVFGGEGVMVDRAVGFFLDNIWTRSRSTQRHLSHFLFFPSFLLFFTPLQERHGEALYFLRFGWERQDLNSKAGWRLQIGPRWWE